MMGERDQCYQITRPSGLRKQKQRFCFWLLVRDLTRRANGSRMLYHSSSAALTLTHRVHRIMFVRGHQTGAVCCTAIWQAWSQHSGNTGLAAYISFSTVEEQVSPCHAGNIECPWLVYQGSEDHSQSAVSGRVTLPCGICHRHEERSSLWVKCDCEGANKNN